WVVRSNRFEEAENVLRAGGGPECEELVIRVRQTPTTADRYEARIPDFREDHGGAPSRCARLGPRARPSTHRRRRGSLLGGRQRHRVDEGGTPGPVRPGENKCRRRRYLHAPTLERVALVEHARHYADVPVLARDEI